MSNCCQAPTAAHFGLNSTWSHVKSKQYNGGINQMPCSSILTVLGIAKPLVLLGNSSTCQREQCWPNRVMQTMLNKCNSLAWSYQSWSQITHSSILTIQSSAGELIHLPNEIVLTKVWCSQCSATAIHLPAGTGNTISMAWRAFLNRSGNWLYISTCHIASLLIFLLNFKFVLSWFRFCL